MDGEGESIETLPFILDQLFPSIFAPFCEGIF